ncbi:MAG: hypothetical protein ACPL6C_03700, partial [bacterium]
GSGFISMHIDSIIDPYTVIVSSDEPIIAHFYGDTIYITIYAYDNDFDFLNPSDRSLGIYQDTIPVLRGPEASVVQYRDGSYVGYCEPYGEIIVHLYDQEGVDPSSIILIMNARRYTITTTESLQYANDTLRLIYDPDMFDDGDTVLVKVFASDIHGLPMRDTLVWRFIIDYKPPNYSLVYPNVWMIRDESPQIVLHVHDDLAGIDEHRLYITINGIEY